MSPSPTVTQQLTAYLIVGLDTCLEFPAAAEYDKNDPYAVRLSFPAAHHPAAPAQAADVPSWTFGRELLDDGLREPAGDGDVHVWPCGPDLVMIELRSEAGSALLAVAARELRTFLFLSYAEVPPGYEGGYLELDRLLHDLMGRA
jgi:hypothetical protein